MSEYTKEYRIAQLLAKEMTETLSAEEQQELNAWEEENPPKQELHSTILNPQNKQQRDQFIEELDVRSSWQNVKRGIRVPRTGRKSLFIRLSGIAASILLLASVSTWVYHIDHTPQIAEIVDEIQTGTSKAVLITSSGKQIILTQQDSTQTITLGNGQVAINHGAKIEYTGIQDTSVNSNERNIIRVPRGGEFELILPDNTHVWLNADTELSFPVKFDKDKRMIELKGEAYFSVAKNERCPFIVKTHSGIEIEVLGTQFNVQAYPEEKLVETTLSQGVVKVSDGKQHIRLKPNQQAIYNKADNRLTSREVDARLYSSWKDGLFIFENESLENIMNTLGRWYNINVFYTNTFVQKYHFTGDLERYSDFKKALRMIEQATSIHFVINGDSVMVEETSK